MNTARRRAAQITEDSKAAERRAKLISIIGVASVAIIVIGILTFAFLNRNTSSATGPTA